MSKIEDYAFAYCTSLTSVTNLAASPQSITKYVFPEQSVGLYNSASYWRSFKIEGINGVDGVEADEAAKVVEGYYDLKGARLAEPVRGEVNLVRYTDGTARKVIVE